jgi:hypothetical protein
MPTEVHDLVRAMVVLTIKDYQTNRISKRKLEKFCALCGYYVSAKKLSNKLLKWNNKTSIL